MKAEQGDSRYLKGQKAEAYMVIRWNVTATVCKIFFKDRTEPEKSSHQGVEHTVMKMCAVVQRAGEKNKKTASFSL